MTAWFATRAERRIIVSVVAASVLILALGLVLIACLCAHERPAPAATFSNSRAIGDLRWDEARRASWGVVYEFTDPANGERFLVVVSRQGVAIAPAHPPLPQPAPYPAGGGTADALDQ